ncbi:DUF4861 domain-containing protein [bacterium]|nr:DUF4861 domain-containing protein [bacterium]
MSRITTFILGLVCAFAGVSRAFPADYGWYTEGDFFPASRIRVVVTNTLNFERKDCPVIIRREIMPLASLESRWVTLVDPTIPSQPKPSVETLKKIGSGATREETNGHWIPHQLDDLDQDGLWDEVFFMTDFKPLESKTFFLYIGFNFRGKVEHETHAELGWYEKQLVPYWESKLMGWKLWYSTDVDMFGKREPMLVIPEEAPRHISGYVAPSEFGHDIMTVSETFGAGGLCLFEDPSQPGLISRPRFNPYHDKGPVHAARYSYHTVLNGPLRSMVKVRCLNWRTGRGEYEYEQTYTAYKNKSYSISTVHFTMFLPEERGTGFGCGIRKMPNEYTIFRNEGMVVSFAKDVIASDPDVEKEWETQLKLDFEGIALVVPDSLKPRYQFVEAYEGNHAMCIPVTENHTYEYLIAAGWSEGTVNRNEQEFRKYMLDTQKEYNNPVVISDIKAEYKQ